MDTNRWLDYGIDCDRGLKNCMGNPAFYRKILSMFLCDECVSRAKTAFAEGDRKELFNRMHELKGTSGNAALTGLFQATVPLVELLRGGDADPAEVARLFTAVTEVYDRVCEGITLILTEG